MPITLITGATKGIGRATAELFARKGHHLAICSRNAEDLASTRASLMELNGEIEVFTQKVDVSNQIEVEGYAESVISHYGQIDMLINNAGVFIPGSITEEPAGNLETMIDTNLYSAYHLTRKIIPHMPQNGSSHIINICSIASITAYANGGSYAISKWAMLGFSKCLREELKPKGIKVTAVLPGATWSDSWAGVDLPQDRLMEASDIAEVIYNAVSLGKNAVIEDIVIRPQLGDL